jgi:hypothetical protein
MGQADMRIAVVMGGAPGEGDAALVEDGHDMPAAGYALRFALGVGKAGHVAGCACCMVRGPAADALTALFRARAMGMAPFFGRVVVLASAAGEAAVAEALEGDVMARARFRVA